MWKKCLGEGEHVVFVNEFNHKVFNVDNPDKLKDLMGHRVAVKGNVDQTAGTIHVDEVNPLPRRGKRKLRRHRWTRCTSKTRLLKSPRQPQSTAFLLRQSSPDPSLCSYQPGAVNKARLPRICESATWI